MKRRVALATSADLPDLAEDDRGLLDELRARGAEADPTVWSEPSVEWSAYDAVVVRSCWDYHLRLDEFVGWIDRVERDGVRLLNPPELLRWNARKAYLRELDAKGIEVVPTRWIGPTDDAARRIAESGWGRIVIKPEVSASAFETWSSASPTSRESLAHVARLQRRGIVMVQPYLREIETDGEHSLVFLDGKLSHAIRKRPAPGDFRSQEEHGGRLEVSEPDPRAVRAGNAALAALPVATLYARVDGVVRDGRFLLMELELIEPALYLGMGAGAAGRMAEAILRTLG